MILVGNQSFAVFDMAGIAGNLDFRHCKLAYIIGQRDDGDGGEAHFHDLAE